MISRGVARVWIQSRNAFSSVKSQKRETIARHLFARAKRRELARNAQARGNSLGVQTNSE